jgi:GDP-4-dehydro-6-deoxy-D-mannose reductase
MRADVTLVTGATGFAGWHLLSSLDQRGTLVGCCRPGGQPPKPGGRITWQGVDLTDRDSVISAVAETRPSRIFHIAGAPNVATSWSSAVSHLAVNALGTHHVLEAVRLRGEPCRVLVVSSGQIYRSSDDPIDENAPLAPSTPYGLSKLAQDQLALNVARDERLDVVVARPFNHIGPGQQPGFAVSSFARQIARIERGLEPPTLRVGNLEARRDITDVRDVVRAYGRIMEGGTSGRAYNVCSGRSWRIRDLLHELLNLSSASIDVEIDAARFRRNDVPIVQGDGSRIRSELDWTPTIRVEQTLRDTLEWWREQISDQQKAENSRLG